jgi:hypothetical protein
LIRLACPAPRLADADQLSARHPDASRAVGDGMADHLGAMTGWVEALLALKGRKKRYHEEHEDGADQGFEACSSIRFQVEKQCLAALASTARKFVPFGLFVV